MWFCFRFCFLFSIFYLRVFDFLFPFLVLARFCFRKHVSQFCLRFWVLSVILFWAGMCFCFELCDSVSRSLISGWRFVIVFWALLFFATVSSFVIFWLWSFVILFQEFLTLFSLLCCSVLSLQPGHRYVVLQTLLLKTLMLIPSLQVITLPPFWSTTVHSLGPILP